jgi:hypothetical protein
MTEPQVFSPATYSLRTQDLLPPEDLDEDPDVRQAEYRAAAKRLDVDDLMVVVGEMFSNSPVLRSLVVEALGDPFRADERKHFHVNDCLKLGDDVATVIAQAMDDAVGMRLAGRAA